MCVCVCVCVCVCKSVLSAQSLSGVQLFETPWKPTRLLCPWDFPRKNTGVGCHFLLQGVLQGIFLTQGLNPHLLHQQADSLLQNHQGSPHHGVAGLKLISPSIHPSITLFYKHVPSSLRIKICAAIEVSRHTVPDLQEPLSQSVMTREAQ